MPDSAHVSAQMKAREHAASQAVFTQTIGGQAVASAASFDVVNPATGAAFARSPMATKEELDAAVAAARIASRGWAALGFAARREHLLRFAQGLQQHADELAALLTLEQGKPFANSLAEVQRTARTIDVVSTIPMGNEVLRSDERGRVEMRYRPLGVVGAITPWNVPVGLAIGKIVHALYTGNTLVLKPSPYTPLATLRMGDIARATLPPGVLNVVSGNDELGRWMTEHEGIDKISFTGSGPTGKRVMAGAAANLKRLTLELGGNDAAVVLGDADVAAIAPKLFAASFANSGQICMAIKRLYVHASKYEAVCEALAALARDAHVGDGFEEGVQFGPVQNAAQFARVRELLADTRARGGHFLAGGGTIARAGYFVAPAVVTGLSDGSRLVDEEQFGPVLPVMRFDGEDEAIARANGTPFGLSASVWSADPERAARMAGQLEAGTVWVNQHLALDPLVPFGGAKQSGLGREFSSVGLRSYMEATAIFVPAA